VRMLRKARHTILSVGHNHVDARSELTLRFENFENLARLS